MYNQVTIILGQYLKPANKNLYWDKFEQPGNENLYWVIIMLNKVMNADTWTSLCKTRL